MFGWLTRWRRRKLDDPYRCTLFLNELLTIVRDYGSGDELRRRVYALERAHTAMHRAAERRCEPGRTTV